MKITRPPTSRIRCQPNSKPIPNSSSTKPKSANSVMVSGFATAFRADGPINAPATKYPTTGGSLICRHNTSAVPRDSHNDGEVTKEVRLAVADGQRPA